MSGEHPFAEFVRILGKGKTGRRNLSQAEAYQAFTMILEQQVEPVQLGAFLMLLRVKEETSEELAGFVQACRDCMPVQRNSMKPDLDWPSYAGKTKQHPWFILSALLLARNGISVLLHGSEGHTQGRLYTGPTLSHLGVAAADSVEVAAVQLQRTHFAWLPLKAFCPVLEDIIQLKPLLGLRSPVNTLARLLNPGSAPFSLQSVFHPAYAQLHHGANALLRQANALVFKGDGGEAELKPQADSVYTLLRGKEVQTHTWGRSLSERPQEVDTPSPQALRDVWRGEQEDHYGRLAVIETTAITLLLLSRAETADDARHLATSWWEQRDKGAV